MKNENETLALKLAKEASLTMQEILLQVMLTAIEANIILNMLIKI